ncbi:methyltransferase domain-containing protein [Phenylobacterium sp.]|uniref:class I SAM-dependent methyltransferase n=1 Tax=Phenylobacterium sp. TaxID=1871053 RepID=UPI00301D315B
MESHLAASSNTYAAAWTPAIYDGLIWSMFLPLGGVGRMRDQAVARMGLVEGQRVLELGCGTGALTCRLIARGAGVTAIDGSGAMLARARTRAPAATFIRTRLEALPELGGFDHALCAFVLHELPADARRQVLGAVGRMLQPDGRLTILDHAAPSDGTFARVWRGFLSRLEPPSVVECLADGYDRDLQACGYDLVSREILARGCAQLVIARPGVGAAG